MDIGRSFSYVFEDQQWLKKVLIGGIINLIPIVNFAATGYWLEQTKRVYNDQTLPLPEWDNFGGYFMKGLMTFVATFVYSLPAILIYCCAFILPAVLVSSGSTGSGSSQQNGPLASLAPILAICGICLLLLYVLALLVFVPALMIRYATTDQFGAFFQFGPAWQLISANIGSYVTALVVFVIAAMVAGLVGSIACGIGAAFTGFWATLVGAYLFGSFARGTAAAMPPAYSTGM
ncbi:MAG: DUF4013 domain-containing protein [Chloroflexi bacterium]|nr:DUF4013 domain-containing protein [Chloroflexota bacterium]